MFLFSPLFGVITASLDHIMLGDGYCLHLFLSMSQYTCIKTFHVIFCTFLEKYELGLSIAIIQHFIILLDGHDSRATYGEEKAAIYSYKLK